MTKTLFICFLILAFSTSAYGDKKKFKCPPVPVNKERAVKKAGRYFANGAKLATKEKYQKSLEQYLCSLKMKEHSNTMFNIAQISKLIEDKGPALQKLRKFRNRNAEHPSVPDIEKLIEKMEKGEFDEISPESIANGHSDSTDAESLEETPQPNDTSLVDTEIPKDTTILASKEQKSTSKLKTAGLVFLISGGAMAILGIGTNIGAGKSKDNALASTDYDTFDYYESKYKNLSAGAAVGYIFATACIATGIILLVRTKKKNAPPAIAIEPNSSTLGLSITF